MRTSHPRGFSLIEVLVVLAIISIALTAVSLSLTRPANKSFELELQRFERITLAASERAMMLGRAHRLVMDSQGYQVDEYFMGQWRQVPVSPFERRRWPEPISAKESRTEILISPSGPVAEREFSLLSGSREQRLRIDVMGRLHRLS